jgi:hypothetical protein
MGNTSNCSNLCTLKPKEEDIIKEEIDKNKYIIIIQKYYRSYINRKKFKKQIMKIIKYKKKKYFKENDTLTIKSSWEFCFPFKQKYDFSMSGIKKLRSDIYNFYSKFFVIKNFNKYIYKKQNSESNIRLNTDENIPNNNNILEHKEKKIIPIDSIKGIINSPGEYKYDDIFKIYFLSSLSKNFDIGRLEKAVKNINYELEEIKDQNNFFLKEHFYNNEFTDPNQLETNHYFYADDINSETIEKLNDNNDPYFMKLIEQLEEDEKKKCSVKSFKDNNKVNYQGSVKDNTDIKHGLGKEYFIENVKKNNNMKITDNIETDNKNNNTLQNNNEKQLKYKYCGYFQNNEYHCLGMLIKENEECYYGEFRNGLKHGYGYYSSNSFNYNGFFYKDNFEGYGEFLLNNFHYIGNFHKGIFNGFGYMKTENDCEIIGNFIDGKLNGLGYFKWTSGEEYYGHWVNGKMDGYGKFIFKDKEFYLGHYKDDLKHGKGEYHFENGYVLKGNWKEGKKEGKFLLNKNEDFKKYKSEPNEIIIDYVNDVQVSKK